MIWLKENILVSNDLSEVILYLFYILDDCSFQKAIFLFTLLCVGIYCFFFLILNSSLPIEKYITIFHCNHCTNCYWFTRNGILWNEHFKRKNIVLYWKLIVSIHCTNFNWLTRNGTLLIFLTEKILCCT